MEHPAERGFEGKALVTQNLIQFSGYVSADIQRTRC